MEAIGFLFDLDGVLIDSEREYTRIWHEINILYPTGIENFENIIKGQTLQKILEENYPNPEVRQSVKTELHEREKKMRYSYCPGADNFLKKLNERNAKIAVVTSSDEVKMNHLHNDLPSFKERINVIIDASKVKKSKPDPEGYLLGADALKVNIRKCVVFEDSVQGVRAGRNAGAYVIGITGTKTREELMPYSDRVIDCLNEVDINELIEILKRI